MTVGGERSTQVRISCGSTLTRRRSPDLKPPGVHPSRDLCILPLVFSTLLICVLWFPRFLREAEAQ